MARDGNEVAEHVESLDPDRARAIGAAPARARVCAEHTHVQRVEQVEAIPTGVAR